MYKKGKENKNVTKWMVIFSVSDTGNVMVK